MLAQRAVLAARRSAAHARIQGRIRRHNGSNSGPHHTYFQEPLPPKQYVKPKLRWRVLRGTLLAFTSAVIGGYIVTGDTLASVEALRRELAELNGGLRVPNGYLGPEIPLEEYAYYERALTTTYLDEQSASEVLDYGSYWGTYPDAGISHGCSLPSNIPCEDFLNSGSFSPKDTPERHWYTFSVLDGHAGPRLAFELAQKLQTVVGGHLTQAGALHPTSDLSRQDVNNIVADAFEEVDKELLKHCVTLMSVKDRSRAFQLTVASLVDQGSCALMAIYDPYARILRVANTGDSRAVLGRWNEAQQRYVAIPMSNDHTGFNQDEVKRLQAEHPGEPVIDSSTGRLFGLAVTRAFGDSRWKLPEYFTNIINQDLWGNPPRPDGVVKTPPYLTARPEVKDIDIQYGPKPDFLILSSDGLWDHLTSEQAVELVQMWLDKYDPEHHPRLHCQAMNGLNQGLMARGPVSVDGSPPDISSATAVDADDADLYYDASDKCLKWRNKTEHFVVKDELCANHLIRNALGGKRGGLFASLMSLPAPNARKVRDDITTTVVFFGADIKDLPRSFEHEG